MLLPDIKKVIQITDIFPSHVYAVTHYKSCNLLTLTTFLKSSFLFIDSEILPGDNPSELLDEFSVFLVYIVRTGERDIISVS